MPSFIEPRRGRNRPDLAAIGVFLVFGMTMAALAGTTLAWPGTPLDRVWALNQRAYLQLAPLGPKAGLAFLLLALVLGAAAVGWFRKRKWGWFLAVCIIAIQAISDLANLVRNDYVRGATGALIAGALLIYLWRPHVRGLFT